MTLGEEVEEVVREALTVPVPPVLPVRVGLPESVGESVAVELTLPVPVGQAEPCAAGPGGVGETVPLPLPPPPPHCGSQWGMRCHWDGRWGWQQQGGRLWRAPL